MPANPAPAHDAPDPDLAGPQIAHPEALGLDLFVLPSLLPHAHLLLAAVPLDHDTDVVGLADVDSVLCVHGACLALELCVAERHNVAGADLVEGLCGRVGEVGVDESTVGAGGDGGESVLVQLQELVDEAVGCAVPDDAAVFRLGVFGNLATDLFVCAFELVGAQTRGRRLLALLELDVRGVVAVKARGDDGLRVVHEQHRYKLLDYAARLRLLHVYEHVPASLQRGRQHLGLRPPLA